MPHKDITVEEVDGAPSVASVDVIRVSNGTLTDDGSGQVTINTSGSGNVATDTIWDAKGDLAVATGADAASKLAVGTNAHVLTADSTQATGVKWAAPATPIFRGCRIYNSGTQSINNATDTVLTFDSEEFDSDAYHSTSSNTSRITIPTGLGGKYLVGCKVEFAGNATPARFVRFLKNGASVRASMVTEPSPTAATTADLMAETILDLAAGDYVEVLVFQNSGGPLNVGSATDYAMNGFWVALIGT